MPPNASGVTNSVASTRPNRSTTVSQTTDERSQCLRGAVGEAERRRVGGPVSGAGASRTAAPAAVASALVHPRRDLYDARRPRVARNDEIVMSRVICRSSGC